MYVERQRKWIKEVGLEIGDKVLIASATDSEQSGWNDVWVEAMDAVVGQIGTVREAQWELAEGEYNEYGISVSTDMGMFNFPFFVLVKVEE